MPLSRNLGTLTSWNTLGHSGPVTGLLYLFTVYTVHVYWLVKSDHPKWGVQIRSKSPWTDDCRVVRLVTGNIYRGGGWTCMFAHAWENTFHSMLQKLSLNNNVSERTLIGTVMIGVYRSDTNFVFTLLIFEQSIASLWQQTVSILIQRCEATMQNWQRLFVNGITEAHCTWCEEAIFQWFILREIHY